MANLQIAQSANLNRSGRKPGTRNSALPDRADDSGSVYSIKRWCIGADKSRTWLYAQWKAGIGPKFVTVGHTRTILESPAAYFARLAKEQERQRRAASEVAA
jgi:hypothetical protein